MAALTQCPKCHLPVPDDAPAGQCPNCLLGLAAGAADQWNDWAEPCFETSQRRFGSYVLGRQIGAGGMGVVYEAEHVETGHKVAIKLIRDAHVASPVQVCRFTIEAEAAARLDHPHIVRIHEVGECHGHPFFSMDLIAGESLHRRIARGDFASLHQAGDVAALGNGERQRAIARLMAKTARAIHHAHERGVLHRDLKPSNILLDAAGEPHLTDFGLAKILQPAPDDSAPRTLTTAGDLPGTPNYMAPEQVSGLEATRASDIYGLGAVLYELLTGQPPFSGATPFETFKQVASAQLLPPRARNPHIHRDLETICLKCLERDPRHRFSSAAALAEDLEHWSEGRAIQARPPSRIRKLNEWIRRNRIGTALIASLCLGLAAAVVLLWIVNQQRKAIERDRDQTFEEGMNKISFIWRDPATTEVTISARELAILAGHSPADLSRAPYQLSFGVSTDGEPSSMAQRYARVLGDLQTQMKAELGEPVAFRLKLFKRFNQDEDSLGRGEADFMVLSAVDYLRAEGQTPGVVAIACEKAAYEGVIFGRADSGVRRLADLAGKSVAFPDPDLSITAWAKARLAGAGLRATDLGSQTNILDQGLESGRMVISYYETVNSALRGDVDAGITYRDRFERCKHLGLALLDHSPQTPNVLAARKGLDRNVVRSMSHAVNSLKGEAGFESILSDLPAEWVPARTPYFDTLRRALEEARAFDGE